jgi:hypothetical protein
MSRLERYPDGSQAAEACGRQILEWLDGAIAEQGQATLAISGGSSPRPMFEMFARTRFRWDLVHLFWVDERGVPPADAQSNFKLADEAWVAPAQFPRTNVHRMEGELPAQTAAQREVAHRVLIAALGEALDDVVEDDLGAHARSANSPSGSTSLNGARPVPAILRAAVLDLCRLDMRAVSVTARTLIAAVFLTEGCARAPKRESELEAVRAEILAIEKQWASAIERRDAAACRRAAIESLSKNLTDGFVSALFWYVSMSSCFVPNAVSNRSV